MNKLNTSSSAAEAAPFRGTSSATLSTALSTRHNSLNFVRLVLAASVIFGHSWSIGGFSQTAFAWLGDWAVCGFFAISGYLIAGSRMRLPFWTFTLHRSLRIYPAFWVCIVLVAFVAAPLSTLFSGERYELTSGLAYVWKNFTLWVFQYGIDETLTAVPFPGTWNAPLWTLKYEFAAYMLAALLLTTDWARRHALVVVASLFTLVAAASVVMSTSGISNDFALNGSRLGSFFLAGMVIYFLADRIQLKLSYFGAAVVVFGALVAIGWQGAAQLPFAFLVLWLGARLPIRVGVKNDISYGVYIWAWPVQQYLALLGTEWLGPWGSAIVATMLTIPLAWVSWKLIESPAMGLRRHF